MDIIDPLKNPSIFFGELRVDEPITTITDLIVASIGIWAFFKTNYRAQERHIVWYRWFFLITAISTIVSSLIGHAFNYYFGLEARIYGWMIGIASASCAQFAAVFHAKKIISDNRFKTIFWLCVIETIIAFVGTLLIYKFVVVEIHSAIALIVVLTSLEWNNYSKTKSVLSKYMMLGVLLCIVAVICHIAKLAISPWFNHMDLSHVFMAVAMYMMYTGVKLELKNQNPVKI